MPEKKLLITIDIFSGRPNPVIEVTGSKLKELTRKLKVTDRISKQEAGVPPVPTLGYRGLIVEQHGMPVKGLPKNFRISGGIAYGTEAGFILQDEFIDEFVCGTVPKILPPKLIKPELERYREMIKFWHKWKWDYFPPWWKLKNKCKCAPLYEPNWWNVPARQPHNNCYNYGTNYLTNTFAQPGEASGNKYNSINCTEVKAGAVSDGLIDSPGADNKCPSEGHLVALVVGPGWDYHWYRKGRNGYWSHKPGGTAVTNLDNSGNFISDPRTADRGNYTVFCTFMVVMHGHIKIT